jgi:hypothetical protein
MSDCLLRLNGHSNGCGQRWLAAGKSQSIDYAIEEIAGIRYWPVTISQPNRGSRHLRWRLLAIRTSQLVGAPHPSGPQRCSYHERFCSLALFPICGTWFSSRLPEFRPRFSPLASDLPETPLAGSTAARSRGYRASRCHGWSRCEL